MRIDNWPLAIILAVFLIMVLFVSSSCKSTRPGDFTPDEMKWVIKNVH